MKSIKTRLSTITLALPIEPVVPSAYAQTDPAKTGTGPRGTAVSLSGS